MRLARLLFRQLKERTVVEKLEYYGRFNPQPISLQTYLDFGRDGTVEMSFKFLQKELLVRLASITKVLNSLLCGIPQIPSVTEVRSMYCQSFEDLLPFENVEPTDDNIHSFNEKLEKVLTRHENFIEIMAESFIQLRKKYDINIALDDKIQYFLDRFYFNVIVFGTLLPENPRHIGCIDPACDVSTIITDAYNSARFLCDGCYFDTPKLQFDSYNSITPGLPITIAIIPSHLYHILFELFKNSMRATIDRYGEFEKLPPIQVLAVLGKDDLTIKLSDSGGGISRRKIDQLFRYTYTTAPLPEAGSHNAALVSKKIYDTSVLMVHRKAGYGYGLPLSRLYARYFHGDLMIVSIEGYGTDAFLFIKAVPFKTSETISVYDTS
uniref:Protein-serine/threonine kinase n=1 Tax=Setaria digitata TaxID=48799 RepID=A0A915PKZ0_9BILA